MITVPPRILDTNPLNNVFWRNRPHVSKVHALQTKVNTLILAGYLRASPVISERYRPILNLGFELAWRHRRGGWSAVGLRVAHSRLAGQEHRAILDVCGWFLPLQFAARRITGVSTIDLYIPGPGETKGAQGQ